MVQIEQIKAETERRWRELADKNVKAGGNVYDREISQLLSLLSFIESLEKEDELPDKFKNEPEYEPVRERHEKAYIESEYGVLFPKDEKIYLSGYRYEEGTTFYGWPSSVRLEMNAAEEDKEKLYRAFIAWSNKWNGTGYASEEEYSDTIILTDEETGTVRFLNAVPRECNLEQNKFIADADLVK